jgi:hypothetical protein
MLSFLRALRAAWISAITSSDTIRLLPRPLPVAEP